MTFEKIMLKQHDKASMLALAGRLTLRKAVAWSVESLFPHPGEVATGAE